MLASNLTSLIPECCAEVLDAMYFATVLDTVTPAVLPASSDALSFSLRFAGDVCGRFGIHLENSTARGLAANFLGEDETGISHDEIGEVVGELANMLCGAVMSRVEGEHTFALSHPEATAPSAESARNALVSALDTDLGLITLWIALEETPCSL